MNFFESILYGLISGFTEFLPVSSQGHQAIMFALFGCDTREPLRDLFIHIAVIIALSITCKPLFSKLRREQILLARSNRRRRSVRRGQFDLRLIKTAGFSLILGLMLYIVTKKWEFELRYVAMFFCINGLILIIPEYIRHGNKDARFMTGFDGFLLGLLGAFSVMPGLSRVGIMSAYSLTRGADRQQSMNWVLPLCIPALIVCLGFDAVHLFSIGIGITGFVGFLTCILSGVAAFIGGYFGVRLVRFLTVQTGFAGCAYYSWGAALFAFVLYLIA